MTNCPGICTPSSEASFRHKRFCAAAVRKRADPWEDVWSWDCTRKAPILRLDGSLGRLPLFLEREVMMGRKMPPARAVVLGMAGPIRVSAMFRP